MKRFFLIVAIFLNYNIYAFNINTLFPGHKHKKIMYRLPDYSLSKQKFAHYCIKKKALYGFQIRCSQVQESKPFKFEASTISKCKQKIKGNSNSYLEPLSLPLEFIKQMKLCHGAKVVGPHILHTTNILEISELGIEQNQTETFYDVICHDEQNFLKGIYKKRQDQYNANLLKKLARCDAPKPSATNLVKYKLIFKILFGLAIFALVIYFYYSKYKNKNNK